MKFHKLLRIYLESAWGGECNWDVFVGVFVFKYLNFLRLEFLIQKSIRQQILLFHTLSYITLTNTSFNHDWKNLINTLHVIDLTMYYLPTLYIFFVREIEILLDFLLLWPCSIGRSLLTTKNHLKLYPDRRIGKCQSTEYWKMSSLYCLLYLLLLLT